MSGATLPPGPCVRPESPPSGQPLRPVWFGHPHSAALVPGGRSGISWHSRRRSASSEGFGPLGGSPPRNGVRDAMSLLSH